MPNMADSRRGAGAAPSPRSGAVDVEAQRLVLITLNGLALERILVPGIPDTASDLARLGRGVLAILKGE